MPAGGVVELGRLLKSHPSVLKGTDKFSRIDHTALERREDLPWGQKLHVDTEACVDPASEAWNAHLQALEIGHGLDFLFEPAGHLNAGIATGHGNHSKRSVDLVPEVNAATVVEPAIHALEVHAKGHRGEVLSCECLARPEITICVVHLHRAGANGIEALGCRNQLARTKHLNV